jgi:hypothetical protein
MEPRARLKCGWLVPGGSGRFWTVPGDLGDSVPICPICSTFPIYPICPICPISTICTIYRIYPHLSDPDLYLSYVYIQLWKRFSRPSNTALSYPIPVQFNPNHPILSCPTPSHPVDLSIYLSIHPSIFLSFFLIYLSVYLFIYLSICLSSYLAI